MAESKVQKQIIKYLERNGYYVVKVILCNKNGFPDLHFIKDGKAYYCEVKDKGKEPVPLQHHRMHELRQYGAVAVWADSLEMLKQKLETY